VEDDEDIRWLLNDYLVRNGAGVESCVNGLEAVNRATRVHFDAILMDIKMPVMDGHQATSALRKSGVREPIIALTAHASAADQLLCYRSGFDSYLSKPIDFGHLYETLRVHLGIDPVPPFMRMITR
jgi:CheY-like chemotaxis protein